MAVTPREFGCFISPVSPQTGNPVFRSRCRRSTERTERTGDPGPGLVVTVSHRSGRRTIRSGPLGQTLRTTRSGPLGQDPRPLGQDHSVRTNSVRTTRSGPLGQDKLGQDHSVRTTRSGPLGQDHSVRTNSVRTTRSGQTRSGPLGQDHSVRTTRSGPLGQDHSDCRTQETSRRQQTGITHPDSGHSSHSSQHWLNCEYMNT